MQFWKCGLSRKKSIPRGLCPLLFVFLQWFIHVFATALFHDLCRQDRYYFSQGQTHSKENSGVCLIFMTKKMWIYRLDLNPQWFLVTYISRTSECDLKPRLGKFYSPSGNIFKNLISYKRKRQCNQMCMQKFWKNPLPLSHWGASLPALLSCAILW